VSLISAVDHRACGDIFRLSQYREAGVGQTATVINA